MRHSSVQENKNDSNYIPWMRRRTTTADKGKLSNSQMSAQTSVKPHVTRAHFFFFFTSCLCEPTGAVSWDKQWLANGGKKSPFWWNNRRSVQLMSYRVTAAVAKVFKEREATPATARPANSQANRPSQRLPEAPRGSQRLPEAPRGSQRPGHRTPTPKVRPCLRARARTWPQNYSLHFDKCLTILHQLI